MTELAPSAAVADAHAPAASAPARKGEAGPSSKSAPLKRDAKAKAKKPRAAPSSAPVRRDTGGVASKEVVKTMRCVVCAHDKDAVDFTQYQREHHGPNGATCRACLERPPPAAVATSVTVAKPAKAVTTLRCARCKLSKVATEFTRWQRDHPTADGSTCRDCLLEVNPAPAASAKPVVAAAQPSTGAVVDASASGTGAAKLGKFGRSSLASQCFVGNVSLSATTAQLEGLLSRFGPVRDLSRPKDKPFAFVTFVHASDAAKAVANPDAIDLTLHGRAIDIHAARPRPGDAEKASSRDRKSGGPPRAPRRQPGGVAADGTPPVLPPYVAVHSPAGYGGAVPFGGYYPAYAPVYGDGVGFAPPYMQPVQLEPVQPVVTPPPAKPIQIVDPRTSAPAVLAAPRTASSAVAAVTSTAAAPVASSAPAAAPAAAPKPKPMQFIDPKTGLPIVMKLK